MRERCIEMIELGGVNRYLVAASGSGDRTKEQMEVVQSRFNTYCLPCFRFPAVGQWDGIPHIFIVIFLCAFSIFVYALI